MALSTSLISYWKLDESGTGTRADSVGSNTLTNTNGVSQAAATSVNMNFSSNFVAASNQYLSVTDNASLSTGNIDFAICAWVYLDDVAGDHQVITKYASGTNAEYILKYQDGEGFKFFVNQSDNTLKSVADAVLSVPLVSTWYFVVGQYNSVADTITISTNAGAVSTTSSVTGPADSTADVQIGTIVSGVDNMNGRIDGVGFWKRNLEQDEIYELYNRGSGMQYPFLPIQTNNYQFVRVGNGMSTGERIR